MQARISQTRLFAAVALGLVVMFAGTTLAQTSIPTNIGTWKLNVAKSTILPESQTASATVKIEAMGAGIRITMDVVAHDGSVGHTEASGNYDGKDNPLKNDFSNDITVAFTRVDANTTIHVTKGPRGKTFTSTWVVSADGKTMTDTSPNDVRVYDKQ